MFSSLHWNQSANTITGSWPAGKGVPVARKATVEESFDRITSWLQHDVRLKE